MNYKVGDSLKIMTDMFEGIGVYKGATVLVVQECETEGQWLDRRGVEADALNTFANGKYFELVQEEKANNRFTVGDQVISIKNTPQTPEGWIGYVEYIIPESKYSIHASKEGSNGVLTFQEDELELLSASRVGIPNGNDRDDITPQDIAGLSKSALDKQVGGGHYKEKGIQPIEYIFANNLGFCEANIVKYATRWKDKNGIQDLEKIIHYTELLIELTKKEELKDKEEK